MLRSVCGGFASIRKIQHRQNRAAWLGDAYTSANALLSRDKDDSEDIVAEKTAHLKKYVPFCRVWRGR